jgi:hypothetical protein
VPLVADSLGGDHPEADLVLEPLGESPQAAGRSCVLVSRGDAGETREAVRPQPHVSLLQAECERLTVVALGGGRIARVEIEVAEAMHRGRTTAESVCAPNLDGTGKQLGGPPEIAEVPESLSDGVQGPGDPQRVAEALVDRKRLLRPCQRALRRAGYELGGAEAKQHEGLAAFIAGVPVERERLYQGRARLIDALEKHECGAEPGEGLGAVSRRQRGRIGQRPLVPPL